MTNPTFDDFVAAAVTKLTPELNVDLLDKTMSHVETLDAFQREGLDIEERWDQGSWFRHDYDAENNVCGTAGCFAGHAVLQAGHKIIDDYGDWQALAPDGTRDSISIAARKLLGLTPLQGRRLFSGNNEVVDLRRLVDQLKAGEL